MRTSISFYLIISTLQFVVGDDCKRQGPCFCKFKNGTGIDLRPVNTNGDSRDGKKWMFDFTPAPTAQDHFSYAFNPCYPMETLGDIEAVCNNNVACQKYSDEKSDDTQYFPLADLATEKFVLGSDGMTATYKAGERTLNVKLVCAESLDFSITGQVSEKPPVYNYTLKAPQCCPVSFKAGLSFGTILCIIFLVILVIYLVGGVLINKFARGATGAELIPNRSFWAELPSLIKEGFQFTASKIRGCFTRDSQYDQI